jgi:hypothetical protein
MAKGPRKYKISDKEAETVEEAYNKFGRTSIETEKLFDLFKEWQSLKTRSLKRFVISLSFLLTFAWIVNIDITDIKPLGLNVSEADQALFLIALLIIHTAAFVFYRVQRSIDLNINKAEISLFEEELKELLKISIILDKIINEKRAPSIQALINDVKGHYGTNNLSKVQKMYKAVSFFKKRLQREQHKRDIIEKLETILIYGLAITALSSILVSFF